MDSLSLNLSQLGNLVLSSGLLHSSWSKISALHDTPYANQGSILGINIHQEAKLTFVVFAVLPISRDDTLDTALTLLSKSQNQNPFRFLCSETISISVHTRAFQAFFSVYNDLSDLKSKLLQSNKPVIITGAALGGSVASLFTLWLLETTNPRLKRPLCITFGSPFIGDAFLRQSLENSVRNSCFLHVADAARTSITTGFKPFGTFLVCFDSECICIEDPEAVEELLTGVNGDLVDYGEVLQRLGESVLSVVDSKLMIDDVIYGMEDRKVKKGMRFNMSRKLNDMKISMMHLEYYKKKFRKDKIGFYDWFKNHTMHPTSNIDFDFRRQKNEINDFWKAVVKEEETKPQSEKVFLKKRFLFAGNFYRRLIEPLDIAEYYLSGKKEYRTLGRSPHYVMLEKWLQKEWIEQKRSKQSDLSDILTSDSCFWAEVEEATIAINLLKAHEGLKDKVLTRKLLRFEDYMWGMINKREVSPEIFLEKSSFMRWWKEYKEIKEKDGFNSLPSLFIEFMNTGEYKKYAWALFEEVDKDSYPIESVLPDYEEEQSETNLSGPSRSSSDSEADNRSQSAIDDLQDMSNKSPIDFDGKSYPIISEAAKEMIEEAECVLVFSCNDNLDVDEISFVEVISKHLLDREVIPLIYDVGREILDEAMLDRSSVGIMILSHSYTYSRESLDHLVDIMEHGKATNLVIIPIYLKVTSTEICGSEDWFEAAFLRYQNSVLADCRVRKWKTTMTEIASISGHEWTKGNQFMLAEEVVGHACLRLFLKNSQNLARILALLKHSQPSDADFVGIWGMAGIGKTAIAREIYEILASQYDLCYFLQDFEKLCKEKGLRQMRDDFFSKVFGEEKLSICASDTKASFMRTWFKDKKILVFLDDVSNARDVEAVLGGFGWFSSGHRIILTSRRKQVLEQCKVQQLYEMQKLFKNESLRLCKQYLSERSVVFWELMSCSSGIPLALKVLGSSVSKQQVNDMKNHLQTLRKNPPIEIQVAFRDSFNVLDENEKNIFLDLACFFKGEKMDDVVQLLDACGFLTYLGICNLIDESLISLQDNRIEIPVPFEDVGRFIVHEEGNDPCKRSRLWDSNAIADVLTKNSGTDAIEGIFLDVSDLTCVLSPTVFNEMYRLRLLKFYFSTSGNECKLYLPECLDTLPDELRLLHWENYPLEYLPQKFNPENLVELNMPYSDMDKLWEGKKNLEKLKKINLSYSRKLTDILILSEALNLEHIDLEGCTSLVDISTFIPCCGELISLNMRDCSSLQSLPAMVDITSLKLLNLSGCSELKEIQDFAPNLKELYLVGTAITELPLSVENLTELVTLDLENCRSLRQLPLGIRNSKSILVLKLSGCTNLERLPKRKI